MATFDWFTARIVVGQEPGYVLYNRDTTNLRSVQYIGSNFHTKYCIKIIHNIMDK